MEEEGVVPKSWVDYGRNLLYWPNKADAERLIRKQTAPSMSWKHFPLKKVKCESGEYTNVKNIQRF